MTNDQVEQIIALLTDMPSTMNANANRLEAAIHHASGQIINRG